MASKTLRNKELLQQYFGKKAFWLKTRNTMETTNKRASFIDLIMFIEWRVSILFEPVFGKYKINYVTGAKNVTILKLESRSRI